MNGYCTHSTARVISGTNETPQEEESALSGPRFGSEAGFGIGYQIADKYRFELDYTLSDWRNAGFDTVPGLANENFSAGLGYSIKAGMEYTPVALLATQVVAGTNYRLLCEARATVPDAEAEYVILTVYADLQGGAEITDTAEFTADENAQIANPLVQYGSDTTSLDAAQEAVGFTLTVPGSVTPEDYIVINGTLLEVNFTGGYLRKAAGSGDISGDYNEYADAETVTANGREVTLKGNNGKVMLAIWTDGDYTYCVGLDGGASKTEVLALVNEIR